LHAALLILIQLKEREAKSFSQVGTLKAVCEAEAKLPKDRGKLGKTCWQGKAESRTYSWRLIL